MGKTGWLKLTEIPIIVWLKLKYREINLVLAVCIAHWLLKYVYAKWNYFIRQWWENSCDVCQEQSLWKIACSAH